ncbi:MAG: DUF2189 domain-containing protein [Azonexus sp.]
MKTSFDRFGQHSLALPKIRRISAGHIAAWLTAGWRDLRANPVPSLAYGLLFGISGDLILLATLRQPQLFSVAISGFFLVAPLLAAGLYELSRCRAAGQRPIFVESLQAFRRNGWAIVLFGLLLALLALLWERTSALVFSLFGESSGQHVGLFAAYVASSEQLGFFLAWLALGAILALFTFALSVVAVPLMLDRDEDVINAMLTSLNAFAANPGPLLLWAACIVSLTLLGFATLLFGLVIIMPILGHASWHAYRDLVE